MTIGARLARWRWQAYVALTVLTALLLPAMSGAACPQADLTTPQVLASAPIGSPETPVVRDAEQPAKKPSSRPRHAAICHAHCGHSQVPAETGADLDAVDTARSLALYPADAWLTEGKLIAGPERPPQA